MNKKKRNIGVYVILALWIMALYMICRFLGINENRRVIQSIMFIAITVVLLRDCIIWKKGDWTTKSAIESVILIGFIMRIGYMIYTDIVIRNHDLYSIKSSSFGHAGYLLTLMETGKLPQTNDVQFYQQPFFYMIGSVVSKIINGVLRCNEPYYLVDAAKVVSCYASCVTLVLTKRLACVLKMKEKGQLIAVSLVGFLPITYLFSVSINSDSLMMMFMTLAILYTIYWYQEPTWQHTISLAFIYGLGMMTKISCGTIAIFTGCVFLKKIWDNRQTALFDYLIRYALFGMISLPLGLWYSVRNYILFQQPLTYVVDLGKGTEIYCGDHSIIGRFFLVDLPNLLHSAYAYPFDDYNVPVYLLKTALFGEYTFEVPHWIPVMLLVTAVGLSGFFLYAVIWQVRQNRQEKWLQGMVWILGILGVSCLMFNMKLPYGCSMDYRYYSVSAVLVAVLMGKLYEEDKFRHKRILKECLLIFMILSILMYLSISA